MKAIWNDTVVAESDQTVVLEGNHYFPPDSIQRAFFSESNTHTVCGWKGTASYFTLKVKGQTNPDAAWTYRDPNLEARQIKDYIAFWKGVKITQ